LYERVRLTLTRALRVTEYTEHSADLSDLLKIRRKWAKRRSATGFRRAWHGVQEPARLSSAEIHYRSASINYPSATFHRMMDSVVSPRSKATNKSYVRHTASSLGRNPRRETNGLALASPTFDAAMSRRNAIRIVTCITKARPADPEKTSRAARRASLASCPNYRQPSGPVTYASVWVQWSRLLGDRWQVAPWTG
jgi:hypothetical protein